MKLLEAIEGAKKTRGPKCGVGLLLVALPKAESVDLQTCLDDVRYQHSQIARGLNHIGHKVHDGQVAKHRNGDCSCAK